MAQFFRHEMADGGNHASVGCTARHKCVSMAESCHPYGFGGGYGGYGAFFGLQRPPLTFIRKSDEESVSESVDTF